MINTPSGPIFSRRERKDTLDNLRQPWISSPYSLHTWWDMEKFSAAQFYGFSIRLGAGRRQYELMKGQQKSTGKTWKESVGYEMLKDLKKECRSIGLVYSADGVDQFLKSTKEGITSQQLTQGLTEIQNSIQREMKATYFFHMPSYRKDFYRQEELFGRQVNAKFPSIKYDMVEAGNCYAMGRSTACVFHLMRIMEVGVQKFGRKLGVVFADEKNWQNILDETNKAIKALPTKALRTVRMSQVSANLYAVKLAWRNEVMHPNDKYTLEEAKDLLRVVRIFMKHLALIV